MSIAHCKWVGTQRFSRRNNNQLDILDLALFIDLCKRNNLDYKRIILDSIKEDYDRKE
jgi:hypothetical protein